MPVAAVAEQDQAALEEAALASDAVRNAVLSRLVDAHERVDIQLRQLNFGSAMRTAFVRIDESGRWIVIHDDAETRGTGFTALIATLAGVSLGRAAEFLAAILRNI